jgi:putative colanic acid biosysnthesis UDP-glucose lipid carrier transferase
MKNSNEALQVKAGDSRLLKVGKIIRRLSIDELPQFFNVLKGEMAIVGPRPHMTDHTKYYSNDIKNFMQRHKCLPGITGWAQVNGSRGPTDEEGAMNKRFQHDLYYIKNWNLMLDVYILIRTMFVVLFQKVD